MLRIVVSCSIAFLGTLIVLISANLSFQGYQTAFPSIWGVGPTGGVIAAMAFVVTFAIPVTRKQGNLQGTLLALGLLAVCIPGDITGNSFALNGAVDEKRAEYVTAKATYDEAAASLPIVRERIATAKNELSIASGDDILAAQRLLMLKGKYTGALDGKAGPLTQAAMIQLAGDLQDTLRVERETEASLAKAVAHGEPVNIAGSESVKALAIAIGLTLLSLVASYLASSILTGGRGLEDELNDLEKQVDEFETEVFDLAQFLKDREAA